MKSQVDLTPFGIGAPSRISVQFPYISNICLGSNFQHERGMELCLQKAREVCLVSVQLQLCQGYYTTNGEKNEPLSER